MKDDILLIFRILLEHRIRQLANLCRDDILEPEDFTDLEVIYLLLGYVNFTQTEASVFLTTHDSAIQPVNDFPNFIFAFFEKLFIGQAWRTKHLIGKLVRLLSEGKETTCL